MTKQDIFDFVVSNLVAQGKPSLTERGDDCAYRGKGGCKCAAGWLIPDDKYDPAMEGVKVWSRYVKTALPTQEDNDLRLIFDLQMAHDWYDQATSTVASTHANEVSAEEWLHQFLLNARKVASKWKLSTEILDIAEAEVAYE